MSRCTAIAPKGNRCSKEAHYPRVCLKSQRPKFCAHHWRQKGTPHNEAALTDLFDLLNRKFMSAAEISFEMGCSKPSAYARLRALQERLGVVLMTQRVRAGVTGQLTTIYALAGVVLR